MNENDKIKKARDFCEKVRVLAQKYDLPYFVVTDGASSTRNFGCEAVKNARDNHIKWEKANGHNPYEDWSKEELDFITFPENEYEDYQKRLNTNKIIYTTRVSNEVGKYQKEKFYNSIFGQLKVVYLKHFEKIEEHPFYSELKEEQIKVIKKYILEHGYDLIGLIKI